MEPAQPAEAVPRGRPPPSRPPPLRLPLPSIPALLGARAAGTFSWPQDEEMRASSLAETEGERSQKLLAGIQNAGRERDLILGQWRWGLIIIIIWMEISTCEECFS